ncbi:MAG: AmmeMemoRadiSam system protein B [Pyrodictiaceae archaeon]
MPLLYRGKRSPAVAGMFYEADADTLKAQIEWAFKHPIGPGRLPEPKTTRKRESIGFVVPHAGYMYSGPIAAHSYYRLALEGAPETIIIIGPNHTGLGSLVSVYPEGEWLTPLGSVKVDSELSRAIAANSDYADLDEKAHLYEHSVEVQLPFLQYIFGSSFRIVPIVVWDQSPRFMQDLAKAIRLAVDQLSRDIVIIASTDFTHYEPYETAYRKDKLAIDAIVSLDPDKLYKVIEENNISMCGPGAVATLLYYARSRGAKGAELLRYATSGDTSGDKSSVVGYAAIRVY